MDSWSLKNVKPKNQKEFVIQCLEDYIKEANEFFGLENESESFSEDELTNSTRDVCEVYKLIIKWLKK